MSSKDTLTRLIDIADLAYQRARQEVYDKVPSDCRVDPAQLTEQQCRVLMEARAADAAIAAYRQAQYHAAA